jgi:hypothetical protein
LKVEKILGVENRPDGAVFDFVRTWTDDQGTVQRKDGREWLYFGPGHKLVQVKVEARL